MFKIKANKDSTFKAKAKAKDFRCVLKDSSRPRTKAKDNNTGVQNYAGSQIQSTVAESAPQADTRSVCVITDRVSREGNRRRPSVCPFVCFNSIF